MGYFFGWENPLTYFLSLSVAVGGAVWALLYYRTDNILGPWVSHLLVDAAIFVVGFDIVRNLYG
jgi:membrane protease YdiL (CAAX protease family)